MTGKNVKQRQGAHHVVFFGKKQRVTDPAVIDDPRIAVLRDLGHPGGASGVEIGRHPVARAVVESKGRGLP
jgi:hypothetical protein